MRKTLLLSLLFLSAASDLEALRIYPLIDQHHTELHLSEVHQNRIAVEGDRIQQIFGGEELEIQTDDENGQIFVGFPNSSKALTLTIVTESHLTHDLTLIPQKLPFQSILLKPQILEPHEHIEGQQKPTSHIQKILDLMGAMRRGHQIQGYTLLSAAYSKEEERHYPKPLQTTLKLTYSHNLNDYVGRVYLLKNEGDNVLSLSEVALSLPRDVSISLGCASLKPQEETFFFVISKGSMR